MIGPALGVTRVSGRTAPCWTLYCIVLKTLMIIFRAFFSLFPIWFIKRIWCDFNILLHPCTVTYLFTLIASPTSLGRYSYVPCRPTHYTLSQSSDWTTWYLCCLAFTSRSVFVGLNPLDQCRSKLEILSTCHTKKGRGILYSNIFDMIQYSKSVEVHQIWICTICTLHHDGTWWLGCLVKNITRTGCLQTGPAITS